MICLTWHTASNVLSSRKFPRGQILKHLSWNHMHRGSMTGLRIRLFLTTTSPTAHQLCNRHFQLYSTSPPKPHISCVNIRSHEGTLNITGLLGRPFMSILLHKHLFIHLLSPHPVFQSRPNTNTCHSCTEAASTAARINILDVCPANTKERKSQPGKSSRAENTATSTHCST